MELWYQILANSLLTSAILAAFAFISQKIIGRWIAMSLAKYEAGLQKKNIRFTKFHEKQTEIIPELYSLLIQMEQDLKQLLIIAEQIKTVKEKEGKYKIISSSRTVFYNYFDKNRLYLSENLCKKLDILLNTVNQAQNEHMLFEIDLNDALSSKEAISYAEKVMNTVIVDIPKIKKEIEQEFRHILGTE